MTRADGPRDFENLLDRLKSSRGFDFKGYKRASLVRRVKKRMQAVQVESFRDYIAYLEQEPVEFDHLFNTILINVTTFFRDTVPWGFLSEEIVPQILAAKKPDDPIRIWSAGCASGQEAYTLAIVLTESLGAEEFLRRVKIYATDLDDEALSYARHGSYTAKEIEAMPEQLRERYFDLHAGRYDFRKNLRRCVIFGRNDLIDDAPISRIDLLVCRNTLMYFDAETQTRILNRFHFALRDGGFLFLGKAETLATHSELFEPVDLKRRVFAKVPQLRGLARLTIRDNGGHPLLGGDADREQLSNAVFEKSPLAQFAVDIDGNLALINARARQLFRLNNADIGRPLRDLEVSYKPVELRSRLDQVRSDDAPVKIPEVSWITGGQERWFEIELLPLRDTAGAALATAVTFEDVTAVRALRLQLERSHAELETAYQELQSTNEELETTNEELHSTVEELETTNEELHSTNEELETMNEELQSTNEELGSINDELRRRGTELNDLNRFLRSIFASMRAGVAVVDEQLRVKVWNHRAEDLWGLRSDEVTGHRLLDLDFGLPLAEVKPLLQDSLRDGGSSREATVPAINRRGRNIMCKLTTTPLAGVDHEGAQGVILLMEEVQAV